MITMYILVFLIPSLLPRSYFESVFTQLKKKRSAAGKAKNQAMEKALSESKHAVSESYQAAITRNDIERGATLMVVQHVVDQIEDLKTHGHIRHLLHLVFVSWDKTKKPFWRDPDLVAHVHRIYQECPATPFFLDDPSVPDFFEILFTAEKGVPPEGVNEAPISDIETFHARFVRESRLFFESLGTAENRERLDKIADQCVERLEKAIRKLHAERAARMAPTSTPAGTKH